MIRKLLKFLTCLFLWATLSPTIMAQYHWPVLTGTEGQNLLDDLVNEYKPGFVFDYGDARDTLFSRVFLHNDSLTCVYSGHSLYLNPNQDPTEAAYQNGSNNGINTEHTYPQGLGAGSGNARSDMHHLYPTKTPVNAARGNFPFGEVPDNQTLEWFYLNQSISTIPSQNIDAYSERGSGLFEPREDHKGNVARAMFYFYTMYKAEADSEDPNYFEQQKETLCDWHLLDPVDKNEWERNLIIASYQSGKTNPFILDCTLAERSYCAEFNQACTPTQTSSITEKENKGFELFQNNPNPVYSGTQITYRLDQSFQVRLKLFDATGRLCKIIVDEQQQEGLYKVNVREELMVKGMLYVYQLELFDGTIYHMDSRKLLKL